MTSIAERHKYILDKLQNDGFVKVTDAADDLEVTTVTIRRDLNLLEKKGLLYRTHGSASPINPHIGDRTASEKENFNPAEKLAIAREAVKLIDPYDSIIINSGTTVCAFAEELHPQQRLTVVTASLKAALILGKNKDITVVQLGGIYRDSSMSVIGNFSKPLMENVACTKFFLGVDGVDLNFGVTTSNLEEAELNKMMMDSALKTIILCDSSKFGKKGFGKICNLDKIDTIITDSGISQTMINELENQGVEIVIAQV